MTPRQTLPPPVSSLLAGSGGAGNAKSPSYPQYTPIRAAAPEVQKQIAQARTDVAVTQQEVRDAQAAQTEIQANLNYL